MKVKNKLLCHHEYDKGAGRCPEKPKQCYLSLGRKILKQANSPSSRWQIALFGRMSKSHPENKTKYELQVMERKSRPRVHNACDSYPLFWAWLLATKSPCMRLFPLFLAWPLSKEELVPGSSDPGHNPHLFWTQPRTRVREKDPSLLKCGAPVFRNWPDLLWLTLST